MLFIYIKECLKNRINKLKFLHLGALVFSGLFLFATISPAALALPTTACDSELTRLETHSPLNSNTQQEDGTRAFKYGSDNNSFVSINGDLLTFNVELLFSLADSPKKVIKFNALNANCTPVYGNAFANNITSETNTLVYNKATTETKFNQEDPYFPIMLGMPRYIWFSVWDGKKVTSFASYSYLVDVNGPQNPTGITVEEEPEDDNNDDEESPPAEPSGQRPVLIFPRKK